eukprot:SM000079S22457  [mRNA]  locus=s79:311631:312956:+ [translate_table: standard]
MASQRQSTSSFLKAVLSSLGWHWLRAVSEEAATMSSESDHPSTSDGGSPLKAGAWTPRAGGARSDGGGNAVPQPPAGGGDGSGGGGGGGGGGAGSAGSSSQRRSTGFRGVRQRTSGRWIAEIKDTIHGVRRWLGTYDSAEAAAAAYDAAAREIRGTGTRVNFPSACGEGSGLGRGSSPSNALLPDGGGDGHGEGSSGGSGGRPLAGSAADSAAAATAAPSAVTGGEAGAAEHGGWALPIKPAPLLPPPASPPSAKRVCFRPTAAAPPPPSPLPWTVASLVAPPPPSLAAAAAGVSSPTVQSPYLMRWPSGFFPAPPISAFSPAGPLRAPPPPPLPLLPLTQQAELLGAGNVAAKSAFFHFAPIGSPVEQSRSPSSLPPPPPPPPPQPAAAVEAAVAAEAATASEAAASADPASAPARGCKEKPAFVFNDGNMGISHNWLSL